MRKHSGGDSKVISGAFRCKFRSYGHRLFELFKAYSFQVGVLSRCDLLFIQTFIAMYNHIFGRRIQKHFGAALQFAVAFKLVGHYKGPAAGFIQLILPEIDAIRSIVYYRIVSYYCIRIPVSDGYSDALVPFEDTAFT